MKLLLDMGLAPRLAKALCAAGHTASHLEDEGLVRLQDPAILAKARAEGAILLTHDLDFSDLLAASGERLPSVVLFRLKSMRPENVELHAKWVLGTYTEQLSRGAIVTVTEQRVRVRSLPLTLVGRVE